MRASAARTAWQGYQEQMGVCRVYAHRGGAWHMFDYRNNVPRLGRILMAYGRDAADVALCNIFGPSLLESFTVWTHEAI